ncbi:hypothetical protein EVAR_95285_1 [Eumeta japonica]|uniref:Uncharacterized protein n=1 Tax=Eumeta variegata TaxID=151549 RepID=A0A4C1U918_EUMVA|nr:hypothetical protein EVAR_95285_1 [Eumeta japonica]
MTASESAEFVCSLRYESKSTMSFGLSRTPSAADVSTAPVTAVGRRPAPDQCKLGTDQIKDRTRSFQVCVMSVSL